MENFSLQSSPHLSHNPLSSNPYITQNPTHSISQKQQQIIIWRNSTSYPVFKVLSIKQIQENKLQSVVINYEKEQFFLKDVQKLTLIQGLHILKVILIVIEQLVKLFGHIKINDRMIGFVEGKCKIWISQNITDNWSSQEMQDEASMILFILKEIQKHVHENQLSESVFSKSPQTVFQVNQLLNTFCFENDIFIPPSINLKKKKSCLKTTSSFEHKKKKLKSVFFQEMTKRKVSQETNNEVLSISSSLRLSIKPKSAFCGHQCDRTLQIKNIKVMKEMVKIKLKESQKQQYRMNKNKAFYWQSSTKENSDDLDEDPFPSKMLKNSQSIADNSCF